MIENQEELRVALEKIHHQEENMKPMETANLEELQSQVKCAFTCTAEFIVTSVEVQILI